MIDLEAVETLMLDSMLRAVPFNDDASRSRKCANSLMDEGRHFPGKRFLRRTLARVVRAFPKVHVGADGSG